MWKPGVRHFLVVTVVILTTGQHGKAEKVGLPIKAMCPAGSFLKPEGSGLEGDCLPCPTGHFAAGPNRYRSCLRHREHRKLGEVLLEKGSATGDVIYACAGGERLYYRYDGDPSTYDCKSCQDGRVPVKVRNGRDKGDTGCCLGNRDAERDEQGVLHCLPPPPCDGASPASAALPPGNVTSHDLPVNCDNVKRSNGNTVTLWIVVGTAIAFGLGVLVTLTVSKACGQCKKRKRRQVKSTRSPPPIYKLKYIAATTDTMDEKVPMTNL